MALTTVSLLETLPLNQLRDTAFGFVLPIDAVGLDSQLKTYKTSLSAIRDYVLNSSSYHSTGSLTTDAKAIVLQGSSDAGANVGIGNTTPLHKLDVAGAVSSTHLRAHET